MGGTTSAVAAVTRAHMPEEDGGGGEEEEATRSRHELCASVKLISDHVLVPPRLMMQRLVAFGLLATAGGIALSPLSPRVGRNVRPQLRFAHAAPLPLGCAESVLRCSPPKMQEAAATPAEPAGESPKIMKKLLPLGAMFFFILFNYTILRDTKDVLVVTAPGSGAEIIPFLKTYVNLPGAIAFTALRSASRAARSSSRPSSSASARSRWRRRTSPSSSPPSSSSGSAPRASSTCSSSTRWRRWARRSERELFPDAALAALCSR